MDRPAQPRTSLGLDQDLQSVLAYTLGWITGLVFYAIESKDRIARFHAAQSLLIFLPLTLIMAVGLVLTALLGAQWTVVKFLGWTCITLLQVGVFFLWIFLMIRAWKNDPYKVPVLGGIAERMVANMPGAAGEESGLAGGPQGGQQPEPNE